MYLFCVLQSWSVSEIANVTAEVEEVLAEQRALIEQEMSDYTYPAGKYNISARYAHFHLSLIEPQRKYEFYFIICCLIFMRNVKGKEQLAQG